MASIPTIILVGQISGKEGGREMVEIHNVRRYEGANTIGGLKGPAGPDGPRHNHKALHKEYADDAASVNAGYDAAEVEAIDLSGYRAAREHDTPSARMPDGFKIYGPNECAKFNRTLQATTCRTDVTKLQFVLPRPATAPGRRRRLVGDGSVWARL